MNGIVALFMRHPIEAELIPPQEMGRLQNLGFRFQSETRQTQNGEVEFLLPKFSVRKYFRRRGTPRRK